MTDQKGGELDSTGHGEVVRLPDQPEVPFGLAVNYQSTEHTLRGSSPMKWPMRTLAALAVAILSGACAHGPGSDVDRESEGPLLAFHLTRNEQGSHLQSREFEGRRVYLERQPVISDPDILHVDAVPRDDGLMLDVEFRPDAAERLQAITGDNIGRALAILFNSEIVSVPVIRGEIGGRTQMLVPATSRNEAQHFLELIRTRWPAAIRNL